MRSSHRIPLAVLLCVAVLAAVGCWQESPGKPAPAGRSSSTGPTGDTALANTPAQNDPDSAFVWNPLGAESAEPTDADLGSPGETVPVSTAASTIQESERKMSVETENLGKTNDGTVVDQYTLTNDHGL